MDLGIAGRKAIVCASSRGLGRACALALARAGCELVINGRDGKTLAATADDLRKATGASVRPVQADVATAEGQRALLDACPAPDILVNNNAGPPFRDFRELTRPQMIDGVIANMVAAIELVQKVIDSMAARKFGRIVNITSGSVKMPLAGLDFPPGPAPGLPPFLPELLARLRHRMSPSTSCFRAPSKPSACNPISRLPPEAREFRSSRRRWNGLRRFPPGVSAVLTSSGRRARSSARPRPDILRARVF